LGSKPREVGLTLGKIMQIHMQWLRLTWSGLGGRVIDVDDLGNLVTNISAVRASRLYKIGEGLVISARNKNVRLKFVRAHGEVKAGEYLCYVSSSGMLELAKKPAHGYELIDAPGAEGKCSPRPRKFLPDAALS
jgi:S-adenosylmethionine hydrolase